ncbi:NAD(P)/FAD-dependent oxidoreductase [Euzebya tangerina]|uniref:NAD(P)/FAD-dependent oxidoreductase n=1 Tax=Euzebya tangerina TaxID=591198 RepID=UPI000E312B68
MDDVRVAIIGAGIIGASCAYHLARRGAEVTVIEKEEGVAMGSTGRSAAGFRTQFAQPHNVDLSLLSLEWYAANESGYRPEGYLFLVPDGDLAEREALVEMQRSRGADVRLLTVEEAQQIVEFDPAGIAGAAHGPKDGFVDPDQSTQLLMRNARSEGTVFHRLETVIGVERGSAWTLITDDGQIEADVVVNAAGAWSGGIAELAGLDVPVQPQRNDVFVTAPQDRGGPLPLTVDLTSGVYFRTEGDRLLIGHHDHDSPKGFLTGVDWDHLEEMMPALFERYPWFEQEELDTKASWWGYYEVTPDYTPILGRDPSAEGWINASGFSGHGVMHAPGCGQLIAEEILDGRAHTIDIEPFRIERFDGADLTTETAVI